jgi:hypothetical protein
VSDQVKKGTRKFPTARETEPDRAFKTFRVSRRKTPTPNKRDPKSESEFGKRQKGVKEDSSSRLEATVNAVIRPTVSVELERGTPSVAVKIGEERVMIIDTGSNISILQPGISTSVIRHTDMRPYGVTGETLDVKGRQAVSFVLGGCEFNHQFLVRSLPTEAEGLLGMDFLKESGAIVDLECNKLSLVDNRIVPRANGTTLKEGTALTVFMEGKEG